jgi:hypothetical protein
MKQVGSSSSRSSSYLLHSFFGPEDEGDMFFLHLVTRRYVPEDRIVQKNYIADEVILLVMLPEELVGKTSQN